MTFEPTHVDHGLVDVARAFGLVGHACAMKCEKCEKEGKRMRVRFRTTRNAKIWSFIKMTTRFICFTRRCCSLSYSSFLIRTSRRWGCIYTLSFPPFLRRAPSSFFLSSQLLPFWRRDNETASAATALRTINLHKCTQLFVNRMF